MLLENVGPTAKEVLVGVSPTMSVEIYRRRVVLRVMRLVIRLMTAQ